MQCLSTLVRWMKKARLSEFLDQVFLHVTQCWPHTWKKASRTLLPLCQMTETLCVLKHIAQLNYLSISLGQIYLACKAIYCKPTLFCQIHWNLEVFTNGGSSLITCLQVPRTLPEEYIYDRAQELTIVVVGNGPWMNGDVYKNIYFIAEKWLSRIKMLKESLGYVWVCINFQIPHLFRLSNPNSLILSFHKASSSFPFHFSTSFFTLQGIPCTSKKVEIKHPNYEQTRN